jgi:hypothetical protein
MNLRMLDAAATLAAGDVWLDAATRLNTSTATLPLPRNNAAVRSTRSRLASAYRILNPSSFIHLFIVDTLIPHVSAAAFCVGLVSKAAMAASFRPPPLLRREVSEFVSFGCIWCHLRSPISAAEHGLENVRLRYQNVYRSLRMPTLFRPCFFACPADRITIVSSLDRLLSTVEWTMVPVKYRSQSCESISSPSPSREMTFFPAILIALQSTSELPAL